MGQSVCTEEKRLALRSVTAPASLETNKPALSGSHQHASSERGEESGLAMGGQDLWLLPHGVPRKLWVLAEGSDSPDRFLCHLSAKEASQVAQVGGD